LSTARGGPFCPVPWRAVPGVISSTEDSGLRLWLQDNPQWTLIDSGELGSPMRILDKSAIVGWLGGIRRREMS